jgi:hypothetical protein
MAQSQSWTKTIEKRWKNQGVPPLKKQGLLLKQGIGLLEEARPKLPKSKLSLSEQPFDEHLLHCSPLYKRSRELYFQGGGKFVSTLVSSPRSLSSTILLDPIIEYSPIERELVWTATDPIESKNSDRMLNLRTYACSLFHEQNHRILWKTLPPAPREPKALQRYLNFAESLVITLDMALADHLGPSLASLFYLVGVTYDPGTSVHQELKSPRSYRNYLQAALHATYLNLELYDPEGIARGISQLFPGLGELAKRAAIRSGNLDRAFIQRTNLLWQKRNQKEIMKKISRSSPSTLHLSDDPLSHHQQYLIAEKLFDLMGLK